MSRWVESSASGAANGGRASRDSTAHATISRARPPRSSHWWRRTPAARAGGRLAEDATANPAPRNSPTGVATAKPVFGPGSSTAGVASACSSRKPALARNVSETSSRRASWRRRAVSLTQTPSTTWSMAPVTTSQKWPAWCSRRVSSRGLVRSSQSPTRGRASCASHGQRQRRMAARADTCAPSLRPRRTRVAGRGRGPWLEQARHLPRPVGLPPGIPGVRGSSSEAVAPDEQGSGAQVAKR
jgi:hypothetical protein